MEHFFTEFRDEFYEGQSFLAPGRIHKGDKIVYEANLPAEQFNKGQAFTVWIKATIRGSKDDQVWLNNVEVLREFSIKQYAFAFRSNCKASENDLENEKANDIANSFRGDKPIRLTRNGNWFVFPHNKWNMTKLHNKVRP